ncbi:MAG: cyclic nucleotide-binding domain-containing protein [Acidobacteria bacterium]|nr:cyclic nucleotide-binding domain-containing protein [Acidobacteriota bacterium]
MAKFKITAKPERHDSLEAMRTHFPEGTTIFSEGDLGLAMYVIENGEVEIRKRTGDTETVLAVLGKGDFFGEMCLLEDDSPRTASAIAKTDVDAVMIDQAAFIFMLNHNPEIAVRMMRRLVRRLRETTTLLEKAVGHSVDLESSGITGPPPPPRDPNARLVLDETGDIFQLVDGRDTTIGRSDPVTGIDPDIDLTLSDPQRTISRRHARIRRGDDGGFTVIEDVGTMNGTFVNGVRLTAGRPYPLKPGDTLVFGTVTCRFETGPREE